jgi:hypothetical protein
MTKSMKSRKVARKVRPASSRDRDEAIHMALAGARAAVITAALCLQGKCVYDDVGFTLRRAAVNPIDEAIATLEGGA